MSNANPRKFSEKIAMHTQKQSEETAAFEQIMREVQNVTTTPQPPGGQSATARPTQQHLLNAISNASFRGGSLPNVNQMTQRGDRTPTRQFGLSTSPRTSQTKIGPIRGGQKTRAEHVPYASPPSLTQLNTAVLVGGTSPTLCQPGAYGTNYLLPPVDNPWRRANSDSAINSINSLMIPSVVPDSSEESSNNSNDPRDNYVLASPVGHPGKPPDIPGVIPTTVGGGSSLLEISNSISSSSLPDLTNIHFPTPIQQPPEIEDPHNNTSPYSTSPLSMTYSQSPTSCSPHSQQQPTVTGAMPQQIVSQQQQHVLNQIKRQQQHQQQPQVQHQQPPGSPLPSPHQPHPLSQQPSQLHSAQPPQQKHPSQVHHPNSPNQLLDNALSINTTSFQPQPTYTPNENMLTAYRDPPRPSPQNSPSPFRSPSPHDGQLSAPPSPSAHPQSADSLILSQQAFALQQHFEQISMVDGTPQRNINNGHWQQSGGIVNNPVYQWNSGQQQPIGGTAVITQQSPSHHQPQTPQTPSSIPDIIFTDCADPLEDFQFLTSEDAADIAAFREGLGPLDTDDFQMLTDPNRGLTDPQAEDTFRQDRL